ncbi:MAG: hypothetical protein J5J00_15335 [Deltaproteobacteria bacterium]|nr:hypothetical protein [Deltaproteobacteria bacterium]
MKVNIYKSLVNVDRYFFLPEDSFPSSLPEKVEDKPFKSIVLKEGERRIALSSDEAIKAIESQGYFQLDSDIQIFESQELSD